MERSDAKLAPDFDLVVVMPVYNEAECISDVVSSWLEVLSTTGAGYRMIVINDGSTDRTLDALAAFADDERVQVVSKKNSGHGPTIQLGYRIAVKQAAWVFQCDSDDEMAAAHFPTLWEQREGYDALFGYRDGRTQGLGRRAISSVSRLTVGLLFGRRVTDVNTPYRLMRSSALRAVVAVIPPDTFAPNVLVSGFFSKASLRICNVPIPHTNRRTGSVSIVKWRLWRMAFRSFAQTVRLRRAVAAAAAGLS